MHVIRRAVLENSMNWVCYPCKIYKCFDLTWLAKRISYISSIWGRSYYFFGIELCVVQNIHVFLVQRRNQIFCCFSTFILRQLLSHLHKEAVQHLRDTGGGRGCKTLLWCVTGWRGGGETKQLQDKIDIYNQNFFIKFYLYWNNQS